MTLPITVPLLSIEIKEIVKSDTEPTPPDGYEIAQIKDLTYTKVWLIFKILQ